MSTAESQPGLIDGTTTAVSALLDSIARNPIGSPTQAFMTAIRKRGHVVFDAFGANGLRQVLEGIRADAPNEHTGAIRVGVVLKAWEGIAGELLISPQPSEPA